MAQDGVVTLYNNTAITDPKKNSFSIKVGIAQMLRGGAIFEVATADQAKLAEDAGACAIAISEPPRRLGISRMADPALIKEIKQSVSIPVIGKTRLGHFVEAQILEALSVDFIDESESLSAADEQHFINKHNFRTPFSCGCHDLGEALRRIREGAAMVRAEGKSTAGVVKSVRSVMGSIRVLNNMDDDEVFAFAKSISAPYDLVAQTKQMGRLPVGMFAAGGGIVTPADAAMMMQLGCDGVFVGGEVFEGSDPYKRVRGIVQAVRHFNDPQVLVEAMEGLGFGGGVRIEQVGGGHESV